MTDADIHGIAVSISDGEWFDDTQDMLKFAHQISNAALFEAMEACIDQGELQGHDSALDCYQAIQRLKS
jgi:hypothetical protein